MTSNLPARLRAMAAELAANYGRGDWADVAREAAAHVPAEPLVDYVTSESRASRSAAFLRTYAARLRDGTAATWEIPTTVASTLEDIASWMDKALASTAVPLREPMIPASLVREVQCFNCGDRLGDRLSGEPAGSSGRRVGGGSWDARGGGGMSETFYKTIFTIWTDYPAGDVELEDLAREATSGDAIAEGGSCEPVTEQDLPEAVASFFSLDDEGVTA